MNHNKGNNRGVYYAVRSGDIRFREDIEIERNFIELVH